MNVVKQCVSIITSYAKKFNKTWLSINKTWNYKLKGYKMLS